LQTIEGIKKGLESMKEGEGLSSEMVLERIKNKLDIMADE